jgi:hypothetical protein
MKKTLLIAAVALAASGISSYAQAVYSQNVVGYVNLPETANQFSLEAPPLDLDGTGTNNTIASVYPNPAINDQIYIYTPSGFDIVAYQIKPVGRSGATTTNWFDANTGLVASADPLNVGEGVYYLPAVNETNTFVGSVLSGAVTNVNIPAPNTFGLVSSQIPYAGGLTTVLNYQPNINDQVYLFTPSGFDIVAYQIKPVGRSGATTTNWFDANTGNPGEPQISVAQGFWLLPAAANTWSETFTNQ